MAAASACEDAHPKVSAVEGRPAERVGVLAFRSSAGRDLRRPDVHLVYVARSTYGGSHCNSSPYSRSPVLQMNVAAVSARLLAGAGRSAPIYETPRDTLRSATAWGSSGRSWWEISSPSIKGADLDFIAEIVAWSSGAIPQSKSLLSLVKHTQAPRLFGSAANVFAKVPLHAGSPFWYSPRRPSRSSLHSNGGSGSASTSALVLTDGGRPGPSSAPAVKSFRQFSFLPSTVPSRGTTKTLSVRSSVTLDAVGGAAGEAAGAAPVPAPAPGGEAPPPNGGCGRASGSGVAERPSVSLLTSAGAFASEDVAVEPMCGAGAGAMPRAAPTKEAACCAWRTLLSLAVPTASVDAETYAARVREHDEGKLAAAMAKVLGITDSVSVTVDAELSLDPGDCATPLPVPLPLPDLQAALCCWKLGEGVWTWRTVEDGVAIALECAAGDDSASDDVAARKERALSVIAECEAALECVPLPLMEVRLTLLGLPGLGERLMIHQPVRQGVPQPTGAACDQSSGIVKLDDQTIANVGLHDVASKIAASGAASIGAYIRDTHHTYMLSAGHDLFPPSALDPSLARSPDAGSSWTALFNPLELEFLARMDPCHNYARDRFSNCTFAVVPHNTGNSVRKQAVADVAVCKLTDPIRMDALRPLPHVQRNIAGPGGLALVLPAWDEFPVDVSYLGFKGLRKGLEGFFFPVVEPQKLVVVGRAERLLRRVVDPAGASPPIDIAELLYLAVAPKDSRLPQPGDSGGAVLTAGKELHSFVKGFMKATPASGAEKYYAVLTPAHFAFKQAELLLKNLEPSVTGLDSGFYVGKADGLFSP